MELLVWKLARTPQLYLIQVAFLLEGATPILSFNLSHGSERGLKSP